MSEQEYEIMPHKLLSDLKYDVEALKKKLTQPDAKADELILEIESLKDSLHELTTIFERAIEETKAEDLSKLIKEKLDSVVKQNETIARGMVAISDKLEEFIAEQSSKQATHHPGNPPTKHTMGPPPMSGSRMAPTPGMYHEMHSMPPPPPPMGGKKRQGLFK
jgi:hypothetical protein